jgi:two-component system, cell cycle sensor histidine kinase and response regulator CckA
VPEVAKFPAGLVLDSMFEHMPDMVFVKDATELRFVMVNRAAEDLLGIDRRDLIGKNDYDFFPTAEADFFTAMDREVLTTGELREAFEEPIHTPYGVRYLHTRKVAVRDADGQPLYLLGLSRDVTEQRAARLAAETRERQVNLLLSTFPGIVWTADEDQRLTSIAGARLDELGLAVITLGHSVAQSLPGAEHSDIVDLHRAAQEGEYVDYEFTKGGLTFEVALRPQTQGHNRGTIGLAVEVTERRRLEEERLQVRLERVQRMESLGVLASGIAHDFNNLLVSILGHASLAQARLPADAPAQADLRRVRTAAERAGDLVRQILSLSKRKPLQHVSVDLSELAWEVADLLRVTFSRKAVLITDLAAGLPLVAADPGQLRQIAINLLTNAADALPGGAGTIRLSTDEHHVDAKTAAAMEARPPLSAGHYVRLAVRDDGVGMDDDTRNRMFTPFFSTKQSGHGLGLAAAYGIVRQARGGIRVESAAGVGTTIEVYLPTSAAAPAVLAPPAESQINTDSPGAMGVLVIDDEELVRDLARAVLTFSGHKVCTAANGSEAMAILGRGPQEIDLVILDLTMPGVDGGQIFKQLRMIAPDVPVLVSSGFALEDARRQVAGVGVGYLPKPYTAGQLLDAVRAELRHANERRTVPPG